MFARILALFVVIAAAAGELRTINAFVVCCSCTSIFFPVQRKMMCNVDDVVGLQLIPLT
jgi:hypothetical protein